MQDLPPPRNVTLSCIVSFLGLGDGGVVEGHAQIGVNARNFSIRDRLGEGHEPAFGFPFICVGTPDQWVPVASHEGEYKLCTLRNQDIACFLAVQ